MEISIRDRIDFEIGIGQANPAPLRLLRLPEDGETASGKTGSIRSRELPP
jgi:hypothetical protein